MSLASLTSSLLHKTRKTCHFGHVFCVLCFGGILLQPHIWNTPICSVFRVCGCSSAVCFVCVVAHLLLPTSEHKKRTVCSAPTPSPPSAFKHQKCACFGTFSVFDHLHPPLLVLHPPPFLALPFSFSFLDTFYLGNYHFRYFPFK